VITAGLEVVNGSRARVAKSVTAFEADQACFLEVAIKAINSGGQLDAVLDAFSSIVRFLKARSAEQLGAITASYICSVLLAFGANTLLNNYKKMILS
jgi:hypothetical protein